MGWRRGLGVCCPARMRWLTVDQRSWLSPDSPSMIPVWARHGSSCAILLSRVQHLSGLVGDGLRHGAGDMSTVDVSGETGDRTAGACTRGTARRGPRRPAPSRRHRCPPPTRRVPRSRARRRTSSGCRAGELYQRTSEHCRELRMLTQPARPQLLNDRCAKYGIGSPTSSVSLLIVGVCSGRGCVA